MPRTFETAAMLKSGVGGSATPGAGDPSLDVSGAQKGLPGAPGGADADYKGDATAGEPGDEASTFGPGKTMRKLNPPSKKVDEGWSAHMLDVLTTPLFDKFYDELTAIQEQFTSIEKDAKFAIREEVQTNAETAEPTGLS